MGQDAGILRDAHVPLTNWQDEVALKAKERSGVRRGLDDCPRLGLFAFIYHRHRSLCLADVSPSMSHRVHWGPRPATKNKTFP